MIQQRTLDKYAKIIDDAEKSGLTISEYAAMHNMRPQKLYALRWLYNKHRAMSDAEMEGSKPMDKKQAITLQRTKTTVVGYREAAKVLKVKDSLVKRRIRSLKAANQLDVKVGLSEAGQVGYAWESPEALRAWWSSSAAKPTPLAAPEDDSEGNMKKLILPSLYEDLVRIQEKFNSASMRMLRKNRGEQEEVTIDEVINLVIGVGLANWPED